MIQDRIFTTPIGKLHIQCEDNAIKSLIYGDFLPSSQKVSIESGNTPFWEEVRHQLEEYFLSDRMEFNLPCKLEGSDFQIRVCQALKAIPAGKVLTYGTLAKKLGSHPRAIGMACRRNPIPFLIPCHRVVSAKGVGGFAGEIQGPRIDLKKWLLQHEAVAFENRLQYE